MHRKAEEDYLAIAPKLDRSTTTVSFGSDHVPFQQAGIPCYLAIEMDDTAYPGYHKTSDVRPRPRAHRSIALRTARDRERQRESVCVCACVRACVRACVQISGVCVHYRVCTCTIGCVHALSGVGVTVCVSQCVCAIS